MRKLVLMLLICAFIVTPLTGCTGKGAEIELKSDKPLPARNPLLNIGGMPPKKPAQQPKKQE
ncbi:MAG TPA: hypothetical protein HPP83_08955 [Candidatus Hydrogenedentes bacterium]|nr:hypothetical protein [Candidatus Hydrogenedentota bacterium]